MSAEHQHRYAKLNDEAVFCRGCGDIKRAEPAVCTLPHYPTWVYYPPTVPGYTYPWWSGTTTITGPMTVGSTTTLLDDGQMTFTGSPS